MHFANEVFDKDNAKKVGSDRFSAFIFGDPEKDARRMNKKIEKAIRQYPEQYIWGYRRFKTRPPGSPSLY